jgi:hypothetical protein
VQRNKPAPAGLPVKERDIQRAVLDYLAARRIFAFRTNTGAAMLPGRGGKPQLVRFGYKGVADVIGCYQTPAAYKGRFFAIEVKGPKGKQSDEQADFQREVEKAGGIYILARSVEDVAKILG